MSHGISFVVIWSMISLFIHVEASAHTNRYEERLDKIWSGFVKAKARVDAEADLIEMFNLWSVVPPEKIIAKLEKATTLRGASRRARERAKFLLARARAKTGQLDAARNLLRQMGFLENWVIAGPFDNEGGTGLNHPYPPEHFEKGAFDIDTPMPGKKRDVTYRLAPKEIEHLGYVHLETLYSPRNNICAYGIKTIISEKEGTAKLLVGAGGAVRGFWNGKEAIVDTGYREPDPDRFAAEIRVRKGANRLVLKVCKEARKKMGFYGRIIDNRSKPWPIGDTRNQLGALGTPVMTGAPCRLRPQPVATLVERAKKGGTNPKSLAKAARYLALTNAVESSSSMAKDFARRACRIKPQEDICLLWAQLALSPNEERNAIALAEKRSPRSIPVLLALARLEESGIAAERALRTINRALDIDRSDPLALSKKATFLGDHGFPSLGFKISRDLLSAYPELPLSIKTALHLSKLLGNRKMEYELRAKRLSHDYTNTENRKMLALAALAKNEGQSLEEHVDTLLGIAPHDKNTYYLSSRLTRGSGNAVKARTILKTLTEIAPLDANAWKAYGKICDQLGDRPEGIRALRTAASLRPEDVWIAEYLAFLAPEEGFETEYDIAPKTFLALKGNKNPGNKDIQLVDQTVVRVFDSGLSSRFQQSVVEIRTKPAARSYREQWIQFSPENQRVQIIAARVFRKDGSIETSVGRSTIPVSEPWYRLYYDVEAELVEFPPLAVGDIVELKYKIEDIAKENIFNDYFGDFAFVKEVNPKRIWRYVLIHPSTKKFYVNDPMSGKIKFSKKKAGKLIHQIFESRNIPGIDRETGMPGSSSIAPYLHLSTYKSWDELGAWYRGLIRNQIVADDRIKETVRKLVTKKMTPIKKVHRIYEWVVTSTRYVGLEFGIHGFKPYSAPLVVSRGFGDCKDKAALLVTMLKYAGIEADFVLIRTRDLGSIKPFPASLAVFNHAIAYVPSLDMWLDGTAEHHGADELPFGDQDADALRILDAKTLFVRTPAMPPERNASSRQQTITVDATGNGKIESVTSLVGAEAARFRRDLEVVQTRKKRFEAALLRTFPGARLIELHIDSLNVLHKPVKYRFLAKLPSYGKKRDETMEIPVSVGQTLASKYAKLSSRKYDLIVGPASKDSRELELRLPDEYKILYVPSKKTISSPFGEFSIDITVKGSVVKINHTLKLGAHRVSAKDYPSFARFCRNVDTILKGRIRIGKKP